MLWVVIIIFIILTVVLLMGKGSFLIAGYNTASAKEKARYDVKKLCRITGLGMGIVTLTIVPLAILKGNTPSWYIVIMIVAIVLVAVFIIILTNTIAKRKGAVDESSSRANVRRARISRTIGIAAAVILLIVAGLFLYTSGFDLTIEDRILKIDADFTTDKEIDLSKVINIDYETDIDLGQRKFGFGGPLVKMGSFENEKFGKYSLYTYNSCEEYVVLYTEKEVIVINAKSEEATKDLYGDLLPEQP